MSKTRPSLLAERLRILRATRGYSQAEVAEQIDVSQTTYGSYERGTTEPTASQVAMLAMLYEVTTDYLLGVSDYPSALPPGGWLVDPDSLKAVVIGPKDRIYSSAEYQKLMGQKRPRG